MVSVAPVAPPVAAEVVAAVARPQHFKKLCSSVAMPTAALASQM